MLQNINVVEIEKTGPNVIIMVELTFQASQDNLMHKFDQSSTRRDYVSSVQIPKYFLWNKDKI